MCFFCVSGVLRKMLAGSDDCCCYLIEKVNVRIAFLIAKNFDDYSTIPLQLIDAHVRDISGITTTLVIISDAHLLTYLNLNYSMILGCTQA